VLRSTIVRPSLAPWLSPPTACHCGKNSGSACSHQNSIRIHWLLYLGHNQADGKPGLAMPIFVPLEVREHTLAHPLDTPLDNRPQRPQHWTPLVHAPVRTTGKPELGPERKSTPQAKIRISFLASRKPSGQRLARRRRKRHGDNGNQLRLVEMLCFGVQNEHQNEHDDAESQRRQDNLKPLEIWIFGRCHSDSHNGINFCQFVRSKLFPA